MKALNEKISEWVHLVKRFGRYLNFSTPKSEVFLRQDLEGTYISEITPKRRFLKGFFFFFFFKNEPKFQNKTLFDAKLYGA